MMDANLFRKFELSRGADNTEDIVGVPVVWPEEEATTHHMPLARLMPAACSAVCAAIRVPNCKLVLCILSNVM